MRQTTLVLLLNSNNQILLWMKKRGFWVNKRNGFWGKCDEHETVIESAIRELEEESSIKMNTDNLNNIGIITFIFPDKPERDQECHIFRGVYSGDFQETEEMLPQWRDIDKIPYDHMREDDKFRLPKLIAGESFDMTFHFDSDWKIIKL